jgi:hypothetical protein
VQRAEDQVARLGRPDGRRSRRARLHGGNRHPEGRGDRLRRLVLSRPSRRRDPQGDRGSDPRRVFFAGTAPGADAAGPSDKPPALPSEVPQYFLPLRGSLPASPNLVYKAGVLAAATVNFVSAESGVSTSKRIRRIVETPESALAMNCVAVNAWSRPISPRRSQL